MKPIFFTNQFEFRSWLEKNHKTSTEILVGFYKVGTGKPTITWSESVDQALCFGWIDSIRRTVVAESYSIRFTPRNPKSIWSEVNIKKTELLIESCMMTPTGMELFENRKEDNSKLYSYENKPVELSAEMQLKFESNPEAFAYFQKQSNTYKRTSYFWILSAKRPETQQARLEKLIVASSKNEKIF